MATTLLARKSGPEDNAVATDDEHHEALTSDPTVPQFPQGTTMATTSTGFGGGFGSGTTNATTSNFGGTTSSNTGFGSNTGNFGGTTSSGGFGSSSTPNQPAGPTPVLTGAGSNAAQGADVLVANDNTDWINKKWRPVMGWMYMLVCTCDFVIFPVLWSILQAISHGSVTNQWQPLTLQGAGLFHLSMGAVLGIAAYGRTKEKVAGAS